MTDRKDTEISEGRNEPARDRPEATTSPARRKLLRVLAGAGGVAVAGALLPEKWTQPVVNRVLVPAHAQATSVRSFILSPSVVRTTLDEGVEVAAGALACGSLAVRSIRFILTVDPPPGPSDPQTALYTVTCTGATCQSATFSDSDNAVFEPTITGAEGFQTSRIVGVAGFDLVFSVTWTYAGETATCSAVIRF